jgi:hypothetical protein
LNKKLVEILNSPKQKNKKFAELKIKGFFVVIFGKISRAHSP